ncbi:MAG: hypothetical protein AAGF56_07310 [Pseudomonadota bacterium]
MIIRSALANLFCILMIAVGSSFIIGNFGTAADGWTINRDGTQVQATITGKIIDRPARRSGSVRLESVSVNDTRVRGLSTYYNDYLLTVTYASGDELVTATAPVSYDRWHQEATGRVITVSATPDVPAYVDADPRATLFYAFKQMFIGLLIIGFGLAALLLPDE